jgi:hypothetical protein
MVCGFELKQVSRSTAASNCAFISLEADWRFDWPHMSFVCRCGRLCLSLSIAQPPPHKAQVYQTPSCSMHFLRKDTSLPIQLPECIRPLSITAYTSSIVSKSPQNNYRKIVESGTVEPLMSRPNLLYLCLLEARKHRAEFVRQPNGTQLNLLQGL